MEFKTYANPTGKNNLLMRSAMQLYALNRNQQIISADSADKHTDYICLECKEIVRLRSGITATNISITQHPLATNAS